MAEAIAFAIERIGDLLIREAGFLYDVREEIERLQAELKRIHCFLKDADCEQQQDERSRNLVAEIRDVAYQAEDVIDTFLLKVENGQVGVRGFIERLASLFSKAKGPHLHEIGSQILCIKTKIADISTSMQTYGIKFVGEGDGPRSAGEMQQRLRRTYPHNEDDCVISLEGPVRDVVAQLMAEENRLCVVSIVGMGGIGKTTLAKEVYNNADVKRRFDCYSWAFVSQHFSIRDILIGILTEVVQNVNVEMWERWERMKEDMLVKTLYYELREKRYLVVLDDVWKNEVWDSLKRAFPNGNKGGKVLFTTRIKEVAMYADPWSSPVEPPFLTSEEGWMLLREKAFARNVDGNHSYRPEYEKLGIDMVQKCGGLPLAIVVLGGLLATKKSLNEWEIVQKSINAEFIKLEQSRGYGGVYGILALSYHDLPFHLKPCFIYFSQFTDRAIHKRELIRLWIAEGFVSQPSRGPADVIMEDIAEQYLEDLINRCMVQVCQRDHTGKGIKTCRLHNLMLDMCVFKATEENFLMVFEQRNTSKMNASDFNKHLTSSKSRRIAIHPHMYAGKSSSVPLEEGDAHLRSLHWLGDHCCDAVMEEHGTFIFHNFQLLRILNVQNVNLNVKCIAGEIGSLIHLRYLGLRNTKISKLPMSIGNLRSLFTLDVRDNPPCVELLDVLWKLECLRHLLIGRCDLGYCRIDTLRNLETLKWARGVHIVRNDAALKLTNLRNLGIFFFTAEELEVVLKSPIFRFGHLRAVNMMALEMGSFRNLEGLAHCHRLTKLSFQGWIQEHPHSLRHNLEFLPVSLAKLTLRQSHLNRDPMAILEKLPNIRFLSLESNSYLGSEMVCNAWGFPRLETLMLSSLWRVEEWQVEEGAMPCLRTLHIEHLIKMKMIPEGLTFITALQELTLKQMPETFEERIQVIDGVEGEDFHKVQHIASISVLQW